MGNAHGRTLRVGLIGTGVGVRTYLPGFAATGRAAVVALSGSGPERAREVAAATGVPTAYADHRELCADPTLDVICVASPNEFHREHYLAAVASGRHVLIEKPPVDTGAELAELLAVDTAPGQLVLVDHQLRFNPYLRALREVIRSGELGRPYQVRIHQQGVGLLSPDVGHSWRFDADRGGGVRLAMGSHLVDLMFFLLGDVPVRSVLGGEDVVVPVRRDAAGQARTVTADSAFAALLAGDSLTVSLSASAAAATENILDVDVLGTAGEAHFSLDGKLRVGTSAGRRDVRPPEVSPDELHNRVSVFKTSFVHLAGALADAVLDGRWTALEPACRLPDQVPTLRVLDAMLASARTGDAVRLDAPPTPAARGVTATAATGAAAVQFPSAEIRTLG
ncbi:Gfo/Idh/MocA family oxidoreductase [Micromonospora sp. WMMD882]|uniref:Gfo/Idh/MocA family protein n=1 Tax=Micromonospora sp. WMMD882 TaxID=3015151 RepID=UPI00248CFED3|nr:Gfo/Idh/MocA family oxidoreductase [Micromonospora sp. WMMD882]WBB78702.1 Gfo/Idh/MocA family oxidoreductase [Micromonospora sp. WMMD882]